MGFSYEIHREEVVITGTGGSTFKELLAVLSAMREDQDFQSGMKILIDCRDATIKPTPDDVRAAAPALCSLFGSRSPIACFAPTDLHFAMGRMLEVFCESEGVVFRVFRKLEDARSWLDSV